MPVREPKGRLVMREYMADREWMLGFTPAEREWLFLTSLWADDDGYLPWDPQTNAADVYRYEPVARREAHVQAFVARFAASERFVVLPCGRHALMPRFAKHPRGRAREHNVRSEHETECSPSAPESTTSALPVHSTTNATQHNATQTNRARDAIKIGKTTGSPKTSPATAGTPRRAGEVLPTAAPRQTTEALLARLADPATSDPVREAVSMALRQLNGGPEPEPSEPEAAAVPAKDGAEDGRP